MATRDRRRSFTVTQKNEILYQQGGYCAGTWCGHSRLDPRNTHFHHDEPWSVGGRTITQNGVALCPNCHGIIEHKNRLKRLDKGRERPQRNKSPIEQLDDAVADYNKRVDDDMRRLLF